MPVRTGVRLEPIFASSSASLLSFRSTCVRSSPSKVPSNFLTSWQYADIFVLVHEYSFWTWLMASSESLRTTNRRIPSDMAIRSPWRRASYLAALLDAGKYIWRTYLSRSPVGEMSTMPAPAPSIMREPSTYIVQYSSFSVMAGVWTSVHSAMKSTSAWDLMAVRGWMVSSKELSSTAHFVIRPVASRL